MEKLRLTELQKFELLERASNEIVSQGNNQHCNGFWPYNFNKITFKSSSFSKKRGAVVEVKYSVNSDISVTLTWRYAPVLYCGVVTDFQFVPKFLLIDRSFFGSNLVAIVSDLTKPLFVYQSFKSIQELCEGEEEVDAEGAAATDSAVAVSECETKLSVVL